MEASKATEFPEIKWFFRKIEMIQMPTDPDQMMEAVAQWQKVQAFRKRMQDLNDGFVQDKAKNRPRYFE